MAIDTSVQPFIQKMLRQPEVDPDFVGDVVGNFAGGFVAAKEQGRENARREAEAAGEEYKEPPMGRAESFLKSYLRGTGVQAREASPSGPAQDAIYNMRAREMAQEQSLNQMIDPKNVVASILEVGELPVEKIPGWLQKNAAWRANPRLSKVWDGVADTYEKSNEAIASVEFAKRRVQQAIKHGINPKTATPETWTNANANDNIDEFILEAQKIGKDGTSVEVTMQDFDSNGNWLPGRKIQLLKQAQRSEALQSKEEIEAQRVTLLEQQRQIQNDLSAQRISNEAARLQLQEVSMGLRAVDQRIRAAGLGYEIQGAPAVSSTPGGVSITPVERPLTTGTTGKLQQEALSGAQALSKLEEAISAIAANPESIGVRGVVRSAIEKARGQLSPGEEMETPITEARQKASVAFSAISKNLRVDSGNMSRYELNKLEQAGDVLDWTEAPQTALKKLKNLKAVVVGQQLRNLKARKAPVDNSTLSKISSDEILGLVSDGLLTPEEAVRWHNLR